MLLTSKLMRLVVAAIMVVGLGLTLNATKAEAALPLGKQRFTISVGGLDTSSTSNWVRLGQYNFTDDGTVTETHWKWSQDDRVTRTYTGFVATDCPTRECNIQTAGGYQSTGASSTLAGTYTVNGDTLRVTWDGGQWEEWTVAQAADGALAELTFKGSNFGATHGYGYGSNADWSARVSMETIAGVDHTQLEHSYRLWKTTATGQPPFIDSGDRSPFWAPNWEACGGGNCLGDRTDGGTSGTDYFVAPARSPMEHRRDTMWSWRLANADGRGEYCYTGNSHVKPMLQVVDDNGTFHGWVGVEASLNQTSPSQGAYGDDIGVFKIAS